jgi:hypothetical protein
MSLTANRAATPIALAGLAVQVAVAVVRMLSELTVAAEAIAVVTEVATLLARA